MNKCCYTLCILLSLICLTSCATNEKEDLSNFKLVVLEYKDFGAPQSSSLLIGKHFYQWIEHRPHEPQTYNIKIVIYKGNNLASALERFPVNMKEKLDYRYVSYADAMVWANNKITRVQKSIEKSAIHGDMDLLLYDFSILESTYQLLLKIEKAM